MSWAKLCGSFCFHRKVLEADALTKDRASGAFARMISWSAENMTSGKLSPAIARTVAKDPKVLDALVAVGMLERDGGHYVLHDFGHYNPTGEDLALHRERVRIQRAEAGRRGASARWGQGKGAGHVLSDLRANGDAPRGRSDGHLPTAPMADDSKPQGKPDNNSPCAPMAEDGNGYGKSDGHLPSAPMANDGNGHGKKMPPSPSPSSSSPPSVVKFTLTRAEGSADPPKSKARTAKHTPEAIAAKDRVVDAFIACFKAKKHVEPKAILGVDHAKAFELAARFGPDEACSIVRRAFDSDFVVHHNATLRYIASKADTFRGAAPKKALARHEPQHATGDEPWLREHVS